MSQSSIHDFYSVVKKRPDELGKESKPFANLRSELDALKNEIKTQIDDDQSSTKFKVPTTPVPKTKKSSTKLREVKSESSHLNKKLARRPADLLADGKQESILKWTKRPMNPNESSSEKKKKRVEENGKTEQQKADEQSTVRQSDADKQPIVQPQLTKETPTNKPPTNDATDKGQRKYDQSPQLTSPTKSTVRKRLFDTGNSTTTSTTASAGPSLLDELREKIFTADEGFLNKLKDFKEKTASPVKLQLNNLNSPTKRLQERQERRAKARELVELSPKKFLQEKLLHSPIKSPTKLRLVEGLNLPAKYRPLIDNFHCLDSVVSMLFNRLETCTFDKIKSGIQKITKKNFDLSHIAQILTVYPNAYALSYERKTAVDNLNNLNNLNVLSKHSPFYLVLTPKLTNAGKMTPTVLKSRRDTFEDLLNKHVRKLHNDYLLSLEPPVVISDHELTRWHPSFVFPNVAEAKLPEQPTSINESKSLNEFWATKLKIEPQTKKTDEEPKRSEQSKNKITKGLLKGLSQEFLDKVSVVVVWLV